LKQNYSRAFLDIFFADARMDIKAICNQEIDAYIKASYPPDLREQIKEHLEIQKIAKLEARKGNLILI